MIGGLLMLFGAIGVGGEIINNIKQNNEIARVGGDPHFMGCRTVDDFIRKKIGYPPEYYPLTQQEKERMEERAKVDDNLSHEYYKLYFNNFHKSLSRVVGVYSDSDFYRDWGKKE